MISATFQKVQQNLNIKRSVGAPVSVFVTKNDHFLKLCHEGQLRPPRDSRAVSDKKCLFGTDEGWQTPMTEDK